MSRIHFWANNTLFCLFKWMGALMPKNSRNSPFPLRHVDPHLIHQCLGSHHSPHQTTARRYLHFCTAMQQRPHWLQWDALNSPPKLPLPLHWSPPSPPPSNTLILWPTPLTIPNGILIQSAVLPQYTFRTYSQTDSKTDKQTDRWSRRQARTMSAPLAMLIESDALITAACDGQTDIWRQLIPH